MRGELPQVELRIDTLAHGGDGLGRHEGKVVFVPFALPGERVRVEIVEPGKQYDRARLLQVLDSVPERITPRCEVFGRCGGCRFQLVPYETELRLKAQLVREQCARIPDFEKITVDPVVPSPREWHYRSRVQVHLVPGRVGFRQLRSHDLVEASACPIADERMQPVLAALHAPDVRNLLSGDPAVRRFELRVGERDATVWVIVPHLRTSPTMCADLETRLSQATGGPVRVMTEADETDLEWTVCGTGIRVSARGFVQPNMALNDTLVAYVRDRLRATGPLDVLVDLYCGAGNFTFPLANAYTRVIGVDLPHTIADARRNAARLEAGRCTFHAADLSRPQPEALAQWIPERAAVVLDPPRGGAKALVPLLIRARPGVVVYVSCDAPAFARDAAILTAAGYRLLSVRPFDMFPKTAEIELVGTFALGDRAPA